MSERGNKRSPLAMTTSSFITPRRKSKGKAKVKSKAVDMVR
jgi:hypothetical protein